LDKVAPVTKRLNRYFRDLINSLIKSGKLFSSIVTKEVYLQFLQITPPTTFEQTQSWWKSFYGKDIDLYVNEDILYKVVSPLKFNNIFYKKVKIILTREATGFINNQDFPVPI
jgi:hypothetical protein